MSPLSPLEMSLGRSGAAPRTTTLVPAGNSTTHRPAHDKRPGRRTAGIEWRRRHAVVRVATASPASREPAPKRPDPLLSTTPWLRTCRTTTTSAASSAAWGATSTASCRQSPSLTQRVRIVLQINRLCRGDPGAARTLQALGRIIARKRVIVRRWVRLAPYVGTARGSDRQVQRATAQQSPAPAQM